MSVVRRMLLVLVAMLAAVPAWGGGLNVTFIAHSGFLFSDGHKKVLVDALTEPVPPWPFQTPSPDLLKQMEAGEAPFDDIDLLLISHAHTDHFSAASVIRFLTHHRRTVLVTTSEVVEELKKAGLGFAGVKARVFAPELAWKGRFTYRYNGITLSVDRLKHGDDKKWASMLDAFEFVLGGKKILFATATGGYFPEEYTDLGYARQNFDLAFLNYTMLIDPGRKGAPASLKPEGIAMVKELIAPKITVLMHLLPANLDGVAALMPELQKALPGATLFREPMEQWQF